MHKGLDALLLLLMPQCLKGSTTAEGERHAIAAATQTLVLHMGEEAPVRSALGVLDKFVQKHARTLLATPAGAPPFERLVAEALRRYIADHDVAEYACGVLRKLLPPSGGRAVEARLLAVGVVELVADATRRHVGDDEATPATTWLLRRVSECAQVRAAGRLADAGGAEAALAVLPKYQAHPVISWNCCEALANMAEAQRAHARLKAAGTVPAVVAALRLSVSGHVFFATAQIAAARTARNLAAAPASRSALMSAGCHKALIAVMQSLVARHSDAMRRALDCTPSEDDGGVANVCFMAAAALFGLACEPANRAPLLAAGLATATLDTMSNFGWNARLAWASTGILLKLASGATDEVLLALHGEGAVQALVIALQWHFGDVPIVTAAAAALTSFARVRSIRAELKHMPVDFCGEEITGVAELIASVGSALASAAPSSLAGAGADAGAGESKALAAATSSPLERLMASGGDAARGLERCSYSLLKLKMQTDAAARERAAAAARRCKLAAAALDPASFAAPA